MEINGNNALKIIENWRIDKNIQFSLHKLAICSTFEKHSHSKCSPILKITNRNLKSTKELKYLEFILINFFIADSKKGKKKKRKPIRYLEFT